MHSKAARDTCDVVECDQPATDDFVHVETRGVLGFRICGAHAERTDSGLWSPPIRSRGPAAAPPCT